MKNQPNDPLFKLDKIFKKPIYHYLVMASALLFSFLLYEAKVSEGGDDSAYIFRAFKLLNEGVFPGYQGPVYPFVLAAVMAVFGLKIQVLKILSLVFMLLFFWFFYRTFKNRVSTYLLFALSLLVAVNHYLLYFASQTYSEAMFVFLVVLFLGFIFKRYIDAEDTGWKDHLLLGIFIVFLGNVRSIGYASAFAVGIYFISQKQWKNLGFAVLSVPLVGLVFEGVKRLIWGFDEFQFSNQGSTLLLKDPYKAAEGKEDFAGMIDRLTGNADLYISKHFQKFVGLKPEDYIETNTLFTLIVAVLAALAFAGVWKRNKHLLFTGIFSVTFLLLTFVVVQTRWDQARLAIPYFPFLLLFIFAGLAEFIRQRNGKKALWIIILFPALLFISSFSKTATAVSNHNEELKASLRGDMLEGYTPDWQNYILMSEYAAKVVPENTAIACRKPGISFIYGEREFYGITRIPTIPNDSVFVEGSHFVWLEQSQCEALIRQRNDWQANITGFTFGDPVPGNTTVEKNKVYILMEWKDRSSFAEAEALIGVLNLTPLGKDASFLNHFTEPYLLIPDILLRELRNNNVSHIIVAQLRRNPKMRTEFVINTISRYVSYIRVKYPNAFSQVHSIGTLEGAALFQVHYPPGF